MIYEVKYRSGREETLFAKKGKDSDMTRDLNAMMNAGQILEYKKYNDQNERKRERIKWGLGLNKSEHANLQAKAQAAGTSMAEFVRNTVCS